MQSSFLIQLEYSVRSTPSGRLTAKECSTFIYVPASKNYAFDTQGGLRTRLRSCLRTTPFRQMKRNARFPDSHPSRTSSSTLTAARRKTCSFVLLVILACLVVNTSVWWMLSWVDSTAARERDRSPH